MRLEDVVNFLIAWRNLGRLLHRHSSKHRRTSEHHLQETELMIVSSEAVDFHFFKLRRADSLVSPAGLAITALHGGDFRQGESFASLHSLLRKQCG